MHVNKHFVQRDVVCGSGLFLSKAVLIVYGEDGGGEVSGSMER